MLDLDIVAALIRETAAAEILPRFQALTHGDIREKGPGDLVTVADIESERRLILHLEAAAPGSVDAMALRNEFASATAFPFRAVMTSPG